jgi:hypothetical protein
LRVGDLDGDGDPDVVIAYVTQGGTIPRTLWNDGAGNLAQQSDWPAAVRGYGRFILGDLEADQDADFAFVSAQYGVLGIARHDGRGGIEELLRLATPGLGSWTAGGDLLTLADLDGDGDAEVAWHTANGVRIARNVCR